MVMHYRGVFVVCRKYFIIPFVYALSWWVSLVILGGQSVRPFPVSFRISIGCSFFFDEELEEAASYFSPAFLSISTRIKSYVPASCSCNFVLFSRILLYFIEFYFSRILLSIKKIVGFIL